ncbi:hypothetical protein R1sor_024221 [Riccia sorocarpa]|uniref:BZIP domain-containing protein n=1 Tax=Riccia sorocarpa TaxID=122646 RepID=A0ABD3GT40_9MARC
MASTSAEVKHLSLGENILLYGDNFIVGVGSVHSVDESELCHGEIIGRDRISVQICSPLRPDFILPYPSPGANTVGDAVNSFAIWDISKVYLMPQLPQSQYQEAPEPTPSASTQVPADERQSNSRGREINVRPEDQFFFKVRKNWANVEVTLLTRSTCMGGDPSPADERRREKKRFAQRKRRYDQSVNSLKAELDAMRKAAESEIEEIKKRAFEEADSIRESARGDVVGPCGASTMTSSHEAQTNSTVVGRNDADEASSIL